jgi:hypothetical protein
MANGYADGFVIVRDGSDAAYYLGRDGSWRTDARELKIFATTKHARQWIETRTLGYWLIEPSGRARIISARAAGVSS